MVFAGFVKTPQSSAQFYSEGAQLKNSSVRVQPLENTAPKLPPAAGQCSAAGFGGCAAWEIGREFAG